MRQFLLPDHYQGSTRLILTGSSHHYLTRVLRYSPGEEFSGRDREGNPYKLFLETTESDSSTIRIEKQESPPTEKTGPKLIIYASVLKGKKFDQVIRQVTETGADEIHPLISRNVVVRLSADDEKKRIRWEKLIREASQQCGNPGIPEIFPFEELKNVIFPTPEQGCGLFFHEKTLENKPLHLYLREIPNKVFLFFGPEGGFSPDEVERFLKSEIHPVFLGHNVLRAETAVIYGTGAVQTILREQNAW